VTAQLRCHHLVKTFWGWRAQQLPDGTVTNLRYRSPARGLATMSQVDGPQFGRNWAGHAHDVDDENTTTASGRGVEVKP
jgi:hypothetical protein